MLFVSTNPELILTLVKKHIEMVIPKISHHLLQLTRTAIGRDLGVITLLRQKLHKMPLTAQILAGVLETRRKAAETEQLEQRVANLEARYAKPSQSNR